MNHLFLLANNIRAERARMNATQDSLSETLGISKYTLQKYENSKLSPTADKLVKMADTFGCSIDWLLGRSERRN